MKRKSIQTLQLVAVVLQVLALAITIGFTVIQPLVKGVFADDSVVREFFSIPVNFLLKIIPMLLIYVMGLLLVGKSSGKNQKIVSAILLGFSVFLQIVSQYVDLVTNYLIAQQGTVGLVSHAALERAISMAANPLTCVAFALFCFACGGCFGTPSETE